MRSTPPPRSFDPSRATFSPYGLTCVHWQPSPMRRPDQHNEIELNLMLSGSVVYLLGGSQIEITAGHLSAFWAAVPHQILSFSPDVAYYVVTVPLPWFLQWRMPETFAQALMQGRVVSEALGAKQETDRARFAQWESDLESNDPETEHVVLLEIQARLTRLAHRVQRTVPQRSLHMTGIRLNRVEQMAAFIAQKYPHEIGVQDIADHVKLHPNYAMNLFQRVFGTTLIKCLTQHRVSHAQRLLVTTDASIAEIALASGFNSISRFNQAFREGCHCTPRDFRRGHL
ncbi:helix-turn-helix domain-containing protein [Synoicihabitans lomoniglobus]|uniref:Helix-turn-helix domain-containing protein n=1 Tax=Synoicihabitans lomoniglobus TaxID=2909285 RepID=A0AAF0A1P9_9BACT|nr:helix-turn-helix domain-containing protein [Opitutaceae bacterium LMO-M01]WED65242.1 helix-turn-helix domain-containing protein [Opitutaceae bacterium LMO-M01]